MNKRSKVLARLSRGFLGRTVRVASALLLTMLLASGLNAAPVAHLDPKAPAFQLREWGVAEGLPGNHVSAVAQDADGFLWLATMAGLVRFDGVEFRVYNERNGGLPTSRFNALDAGPSGRLWIGSEQGHLIVRENGRFSVVAPPRFAGIPVGSIAEAGDGSVWFTTSTAGVEHPTLQHWTGAEPALREDIEAKLKPHPRDREFNELDKPGGPMTLSNRFPQMIVARDASDAVWARAWSGSSLRVADELNDPFGPGDAHVLMLGSASIQARASADGVDLVSLEDGTRVGQLPRDPDRLFGVWLRDSRGLLWVTGAVSLEVYEPDSTQPIAHWNLATQVLDLDEDREGNIWVATRTRGLLRISPNPITQLAAAQGVNLPMSLQSRPDGTAIMRPQELKPDLGQTATSGSVRLSPHTLTLSADQHMYELVDRAGTRWHFGLEFPDGTRRDGSRAKLERNSFMLYQDPRQDDVLWTFYWTSLYRFRTFPDRDPVVEGEWEMRAQTQLLFDPEGGLWVGSTTGLQHVKDDVLRTFDRSDGLPVNAVRALHRTADGSLWIGTYGGGLVHFDGDRFRTIDQSQGLIEDAISSIVADDFGALWLGGNRGIQRVMLRDLEALLAGRAATVPAMLFDQQHGLDNPEATGPYSGLAVGDLLYFSTFGGLVRIDPALVAAREKHPPAIHLLDSEGELLQPAEGNLTLAGAKRDLSLAFSGLHLSAPQTLRFRHRLEGHGPDWIEAGTQRQISYSNLRPGSYRLELQARHSGGPWVDASSQPQIEVLPLWWETRTAMMLAVLGVIGLLIASWRLGNRQMRQRALALEKLVAERTADLQTERDQVARQATRLQELAEGRARFMSGISHELRTPLSLILAPLSDLGEGRHGDLPDAVKAQVSGAHRNAQRLLRLVERLLEVARVEAGVQTLHCMEVDLRAALAELVEQLQPLAQQRGSTLHANLPDQSLPVWIDPLLMESVLVNLMVNGLRHTPPGSHVTVELEEPRQDESHAIRLSVRDNGPGIPPEALPHLFERFFRVSGEHASGSEGFGLGLPLVHEVIERHGGHVAVESSHSGTCFTVQLRAGRAHLTQADIASAPLAPRQQASLLSALDTELGEVTQAGSDLAAELDPSSDAKLVLVVDDNPELRRLLRSYLQPEFRVQEADNGASALECINQTLPDLIITDVMMPVMDGHEFCRTLRASPDTDFIPLLMLTAKAGLDHRIEGLEGGADAYLGKPFDRRELMATVGALIKSQQRLRELYLNQTAKSDPPVESPLAEAGPSEKDEAHRDTKTDRLRRRLEQLIEANLATEDFRIEDLAEGMAQSRATLHRWCKQHYEQSPGELIRAARLQRAKEMLLRQEGSVTEVAYAVGFRSVAHFSTAFRQFSGTSPSQLREHSRLQQ